METVAILRLLLMCRKKKIRNRRNNYLGVLIDKLFLNVYSPESRDNNLEFYLLFHLDSIFTSIIRLFLIFNRDNFGSAQFFG